MRITVFSINPLFPNQVNGGSAKQLQDVVTHLATGGHDLTILCTRHPDSPDTFQLHDRATVHSVLPFKQPFPQPYDIPAHQLATAIQHLAEQLQEADRFYIHDGELLFPPLYRDIPTVVALHDNVYPETILGGFLFQGDRLITVSNYSRQVYLHTAGWFIPEVEARTIAINNGIDFQRFCPGTPAPALRQIVPVDPQAHLVVLHPHRPEPSKGLKQTIETVDMLVHEYGLTSIRTLVPKWFDASISDEVSQYYGAMLAEINRRHLSEHFIFHDWIPQALMPDYYRLGDLTLVLGHFVEAFGNVAYESLACGTPAIVARVGTHRSLLPDHLIAKVPFGDIAATARIAAEILQSRSHTTSATMAYLHQQFSFDQQVKLYADQILTATKQPPLAYRFAPITSDTQFILAPWCDQNSPSEFYHDFQATYSTIPALAQLIEACPQGISQRQAASLGLEPDQIQTWYQQGYLVPIKNR